MKLKKLVSAVSALAILSSAAAAYANTTKYTGPTAANETRVSDIAAAADFETEATTVAEVAAKYDVADFGDTVAKLDGWGYHHAIQDAATKDNINAERQSQLKLNSEGIKLIGVTAAHNNTQGAYLTFTPANAEGLTTSEDEVFYSFTVKVTDNSPQYALSDDVNGRGVGVGFNNGSSFETGSEARLTANGIGTTAKHTVYMTYKPSNKYMTITVDGADTPTKRGTLTNDAAGIYIQTPWSSGRYATIQISDFRYGYVNDKDDIQYTAGEIKQFKTADGYNRDATAAILNVTSYENVSGITVTDSAGNFDSVNTSIASGSSITIGVIVDGVKDRSYINGNLTITAID